MARLFQLHSWLTAALGSLCRRRRQGVPETVLGSADTKDIWSPDSGERAGKNSRAHAAQASSRLNCASRDHRDTGGQESFPENTGQTLRPTKLSHHPPQLTLRRAIKGRAP